MAWKKISICRGTGGIAPDTTPRISMSRVTGQATLIVPRRDCPAGRFDAFTDGNGRIGIVFSDDGERVVSRYNREMVKLSIPASAATSIPAGTRPVRLTESAGMMVVDTAQFSA